MIKTLFLPLLFIWLLSTACELPQPKRMNNKRSHKQKPFARLFLQPAVNHQFTFTNKISGFYLGNSHRLNNGGFEGWTANEYHYLKDYRLFAGGKELRRSHMVQCRYYPFSLVRRWHPGIQESFTLLDSLDAVLIEITHPPNIKPLAVLPVLPYKLPDSLLRLDSAHPFRSISARQLSRSGGPTAHCLDMYLRRKDARTDYICFVLRDSTLLPAFDLPNLIQKRQARLQRLQNLLQQQAVYTSSDSLTAALQWAQFSLDALLTRQRGPGIWAGLPWFNNYWGRDTFISFEGALLVSGQFKEAREILKNFAAFQLNEAGNKDNGRLPNRISNKEIIYNTADGTWWYIRALYQYFNYSADSLFVREMLPVVRRALNGALHFRVDSSGFLKHGDAETWMDAQSAEGAWSPRGNRAVDIQALFYTALRIGCRLTEISGINRTSDLKRWQQAAEKLKQNFNRYYRAGPTPGLYDHLNSDGSPDTLLRPNQIFAVTAPALPGIESLLPEDRQKIVSRCVSEKLTTPYGVLSLWPGHKNFHPWHHYLPYYPPDAAYHNGLIWPWLAGPLISSLMRFEQTTPAERLYLNEARQILHFDAIGNYSELLEGAVRPGRKEPIFSGTVSQAWSLAGFVRNFYQDILGYHPLAGKNHLVLRPHLLPQIDSLQALVPFKQSYLKIGFKQTNNVISLTITSMERLSAEIWFPGAREAIPFELHGNTPGWSYTYIPPPVRPRKEEPWKLADLPHKNSWPVINTPGYLLLKARQVYFPSGHSGKTLLYKEDPLNDDRGTNGRYTYPENNAFLAGIFDIQSFTLYDNDTTWGFRIDMRNLTDPGWHPEYGFQLTFLAIALRDPAPGIAQTREVGHGAQTALPATRAYNRIIYVGGGLELRDGNKRILAVYIPMEKRFPLGFSEQRQIRFNLPKSLLPGLNKHTVITVLAGGQDDHGGAGIGDFRAVQKSGGQWQGGGATNGKNASRVYDRLEIN